NSGKSSFLSKISNARPLIGNYPFTTLYPQLGAVSVHKDKQFIIADIPGIIENASQGAGLGIRFLKHLSRCKILLHMIDLSSSFDEICVKEPKLLLELQKFSTDL